MKTNEEPPPPGQTLKEHLAVIKTTVHHTFAIELHTAFTSLSIHNPVTFLAIRTIPHFEGVHSSHSLYQTVFICLHSCFQCFEQNRCLEIVWIDARIGVM